MDESLVCECGNNEMWFFWDFVRCKKCYNEFKLVKHINPLNPGDIELEYLLRRYNKEEKKYNENWEKSQKTYKK